MRYETGTDTNAWSLGDYRDLWDSESVSLPGGPVSTIPVTRGTGRCGRDVLTRFQPRVLVGSPR